MIIDNLTFNLDTYLYLERYVNNGSPSGFTDKNTTSEMTCPFGSNKSFYLYGVNFETKDFVFDYGRKPDMFEWDMLVHPDMIDLLPDVPKSKVLKVSPTASSRTVRTIEGNDWFVKLAYKKMIGRIDRTINCCHALSSIEVSSLIEKSIEAQELPPSFYFLREPFARVINYKGDTWGVILRETRPYPYNSQIKIQIPAFALFSQDRYHPEDESIIVQLIRFKNPEIIEDYLLKQFLFPLYDCYFMLLIQCGLQLECHAQNCLFAFDNKMDVIGIVEKDAESIDKDIPLMERIGKINNITSLDYKCLHLSDYNYYIMHSFMFDFKLGKYLVSPIIEEVSHSFPIDINYLEEKIKDHNSQYIKMLPENFFPLSWYDYANKVHDRNKPRPYVAHGNPRYRK